MKLQLSICSVLLLVAAALAGPPRLTPPPHTFPRKVYHDI